MLILPTKSPITEISPTTVTIAYSRYQRCCYGYEMTWVFDQIRFYCHKKQVGTVFHIMTKLNPLGEAVVKYFIDDNMKSIRPQTCGSYTVLPDHNSTMTEDCNNLGWNGTYADGKWSRLGDGIHRIHSPVRQANDIQ